MARSKPHCGGSVYEPLVEHVFCGEIAPGSRLVERDLAKKLGVSRIPVRESLGQMVAQGLLVGGERWQGVRMRRYTLEEVRQLYIVRKALEGAAAGSAAGAATDVDVEQMRIICEEAESEIGIADIASDRYAHLDHAFHSALADASHNERLARMLRLLLTESHYVFYVYPASYLWPDRDERPESYREESMAQMRNEQADHRELLRLIAMGDVVGAEAKARGDMDDACRRAVRALVKLRL